MSGIDLYFRLKRRTTTHHRFWGCVCPYAVCRDLGMVNFPYYLFSFDFLVADIYLGLQTVIHLLHLPIFAPILIIMLNQCMLLPQYKNSPPKAQTTAFKNSLLKIGGVDARSLVEIKRRRIGYTLSIYFGVATTQIPAYFQKVVDTHSFVGIITQQLSNSATQQLSNSATQQPDCALINGQLLHSDNNIIIFSHQLLQTANVLLVFSLLNRKEYHICGFR